MGSKLPPEQEQWFERAAKTLSLSEQQIEKGIEEETRRQEQKDFVAKFKQLEALQSKLSKQDPDTYAAVAKLSFAAKKLAAERKFADALKVLAGALTKATSQTSEEKSPETAPPPKAPPVESTPQTESSQKSPETAPPPKAPPVESAPQTESSQKSPETAPPPKAPPVEPAPSPKVEPEPVAQVEIPEDAEELLQLYHTERKKFGDEWSEYIKLCPDSTLHYDSTRSMFSWKTTEGAAPSQVEKAIPEWQRCLEKMNEFRAKMAVEKAEALTRINELELLAKQRLTDPDSRGKFRDWFLEQLTGITAQLKAAGKDIDPYDSSSPFARYAEKQVQDQYQQIVTGLNKVGKALKKLANSTPKVEPVEPEPVAQVEIPEDAEELLQLYHTERKKFGDEWSEYIKLCPDSTLHYDSTRSMFSWKTTEGAAPSQVEKAVPEWQRCLEKMNEFRPKMAVEKAQALTRIKEVEEMERQRLADPDQRAQFRDWFVEQLTGVTAQLKAAGKGIDPYDSSSPLARFAEKQIQDQYQKIVSDLDKFGRTLKQVANG